MNIPQRIHEIHAALAQRIGKESADAKLLELRAKHQRNDAKVLAGLEVVGGQPATVASPESKLGPVPSPSLAIAMQKRAERQAKIEQQRKAEEAGRAQAEKTEADLWAEYYKLPTSEARTTFYQQHRAVLNPYKV